jgi:hypothetical protein
MQNSMQLQLGGYQSRERCPFLHPSLWDLWTLPTFRASGQLLSGHRQSQLPLGSLECVILH